MKKLFPFAIVALFFVFQYCIQPPDYPLEPVIEYIGLSKNLMQQGQGNDDSLFVTFSFTDGDGDLGFPDPTPSVFIRDSRDSFAKPPLQLPYVEPQGAGNGISGEIMIKLPTVCCIFIDPDPDGIDLACEDVPSTMEFDTFYYFIKIRDRAGHESNEIKTEAITLKCH